jgi:hypothetical protein
MVEKEGNRNEESPTTTRGGRKIVVGGKDVEKVREMWKPNPE